MGVHNWNNSAHFALKFFFDYHSTGFPRFNHLTAFKIVPNNTIYIRVYCICELSISNRETLGLRKKKKIPQNHFSVFLRFPTVLVDTRLGIHTNIVSFIHKYIIHTCDACEIIFCETRICVA